jgi:hypothetical protein
MCVCVCEKNETSPYHCSQRATVTHPAVYIGVSEDWYMVLSVVCLLTSERHAYVASGLWASQWRNASYPPAFCTQRPAIFLWHWDRWTSIVLSMALGLRALVTRVKAFIILFNLKLIHAWDCWDTAVLELRGPGPLKTNYGPPNSPILWGSKVPTKRPLKGRNVNCALINHRPTVWAQDILNLLLLETSLLLVDIWPYEFWRLYTISICPGSTLAVKFVLSDIFWVSRHRQLHTVTALVPLTDCRLNGPI